MIDFNKYNLDDESIKLLNQIEDCCINGQSEIVLEYKGKSFVLEPHGKSVIVYAYGEILGNYENFDELLLKHKINGMPLIELVNDIEYGD